MNIKEHAADAFGAIAEQAPELAALFLEGAAGIAIPGVANAVLAYKQRRQERMYNLFIDATKARMDTIEARLSKLNAGSFSAFKDKYFGYISDYVLEEVQEEKIQYITNGFANLAGMEDVNEDFVLTYYDTLRDLRVRDIAVLRRKYEPAYISSDSESFYDFEARLGIDDDQYRAILEKLERAGLVLTKRDAKENSLYKNIMAMQKYVESLDKHLKLVETGKKSKKPNLERMDKLEKANNFVISSFGRSFIEFFINISDNK